MSGFAYIARRILDAKNKSAAKAFVEGDVGDDYRELALRLASRVEYKRSLNQNALLHMWFGEISRFKGDMTPDEVKGECHRRWGLPIRLQDPVFKWVWDRSGAHLDYEKQCKLLASGALSLSSGMTTKQLKEYLDEIEGHFRPLGVPLTDPEEKP